MPYYTYIIECADNTYYTGITTDLERRIHEHNEGLKGAKYTKYRRPVKLVYTETFENRSESSKREYAIKQLRREDKESLIKKSS